MSGTQMAIAMRIAANVSTIRRRPLGRDAGTPVVGVHPPLERLDAVERAHDLVGRLRAIGRALFQAPHDERGKRLGDRVAATRDRLWGLDRMRGQHRLRRAAGEGRGAREELVGHGAEGIDIGALVGRRVGRGLFRRHIRRGAERYPELRELGAAGIGGVLQGFGDAEVRDHRGAAGDQHVLGLDVAMDDAGGVGIRQGRGDFA